MQPVPTNSATRLDDECIRNFVQSLSPDEKQLFDATTLAKTLLDQITVAEADHKHTSTWRGIGEAVIPFIAGLEQYGKGLDVFANGSEILCPLWGGIRIVIELAKEFGEYFEKLAGMLEDIGNILGRLPRYPHLYPDNDKLKTTMVEIYRSIFDFCTRARRVFRVGKEKSHGIKRFTNAVSFATALRVLWKPFSVEFGGIKDRIAKSVQVIEAEADVAERELANKERRRDDVRWSTVDKSQRLLAEFIDDEGAAKVNAWLSPVNVGANHKAASSLRHAESGTWFLDGDVFQTWLREDNSFLWLHAIPGAGKTVLASSIINYLQDNVQSKDVGLAYFYCDYKDVQKQQPSKVLGTILAMLAKQNRDVFERIQTFFLDQLKQSPTFTADFDELLNNFSTFLDDHFKSAIIVVDALDESDVGSWDCLTRAFKFLHEQCNSVKIIVTSRNELPIARAFEGLPNTSIEQMDVLSDIRDFISAEISDKIAQRKLKLRDPDLERVIRESLVEGSKGMFQWVRCQIEALCKLRNDKAIRAALSNLPRTLQDTYVRILQRVEDEHPDEVETLQKVLCWLVRGIRNLTLEELAEAIAVDPESGDESMDFGAVDTDPEDILELLGGLVTVSTEKVICLAHYSVKEFLVSEDIRKVKPLFWIGTENVESQLAIVCLTYLCYDDFRSPALPDRDEFQSRLTEYKFLQYASQAWALHAQRSEKSGKQDEALVDLTMRLFQSRSDKRGNYNSWEEVSHRLKFNAHSGGLLAQHRPLPLLCAAWFGLTEASQQLLAEDHEGSEDLTAPFMAAVSNGHAGVVEAFLKHQKANERDDGTQQLDLGEALYNASFSGHVTVMQHLLACGIDVDARKGKDRNALQAASLQGRTEAVQLLLSHGANHGIPCKRFGTPLAVAAEKGHEKTVKILLEAGANPNGRGGYYSSPLISAIVGRNITIIRQLIEEGADVNARGGRHMYPLAAAASLGMDDLVQELCDCGARVNDEDDKGSDALYAACLAGHLSTVELLLKLGADVNAKGGKHRNALGAASSEGHLDIVNHLIEAGADVHFFDDHYGNALQVAAFRGHAEIVRALVVAGSDPSNDGGDKGPALVCAASCGQDEVIETLFEITGSSELPDHHVTAALVMAAFCGHESTIRLLAPKGDLNSVSNTSSPNNNRTPLEAAASKGYLHLVKLLLELGATTTAIDEGRYAGALNASIDTDSRSLEVVQALLDAGADVDEICSCHESALLHAIRRGDIDVVKILVNRGANVNLKHETLNIPIQLSAIHEDTAILDLLLEHGGDINAVMELTIDMSEAEDIEKGPVTALQTAAWHGHENVVRKLVGLGAKLSIQADNIPFISPLQVAAYRGHLSTVSALIELGSDVNETGGHCGSALQGATQKGHLEVARTLIEAGANANVLNVGCHGSPLMAACWYSETEEDMLRLLVEHGADVNAKLGSGIAVPYPLHVLACNEDSELALLKLLLDLGADPNAVGGRNGTALQAAAISMDYDKLIELLERGADPNLTGGQFNTALQVAYGDGAIYLISGLYQHGAVNTLLGGEGGCVMGTALGGLASEDDHPGSCRTLVYQLIDRYEFDVNTKYGPYGTTALQQWVVYRNYDEYTLRYLLDAGAEVNVVGGYYGSPLSAAAYMGQEERVTDFLERGADVKRGNSRYPNAAFGAAWGNETKALKLLLKAGVDVVTPVSPLLGTTLQVAAWRGNLALVRTLVRAGAPVNTPPCGPYGSPLQAAMLGRVENGKKDIIRYLINRGADVSARGGKFGSVLHAAVLHCDIDIVDMLLQKGLDPNEKGAIYGTPLQAAAARGDLDVVLVLLQHGADVNATGGKYHTALQAACIYWHDDFPIVKLLIERGADVNKTGGFYRTALQAAACRLNEEAVRYLLEQGAEWSLVDRKIARYPGLLDAADEMLEKAKGPPSEDDDGSSWEDEEDDEEVSESEEEDDKIKMNVESIPGVQKPWKPWSRWDAVRDSNLHLLRKLSLKSEVDAIVGKNGNKEGISTYGLAERAKSFPAVEKNGVGALSRTSSAKTVTGDGAGDGVQSEETEVGRVWDDSLGWMMLDNSDLEDN
ncbi:ankyrin repeat-containing domain protein [Bombardia bombarda]|uniref:Ankyrin repeat-containing domain protein n=1 Tax=Bombardia bombarda TaxID=252184 RepID=A0AA39XMI1_9PEZI|nr:ankyrin repeat-containing domain protein [Bombardia bombarda]